jgi:hypothetical protein
VLFERKVIDEQFMTKEAWPLFQRHFNEVSATRDIKLDPDFEKYYAMEKSGVLRCFVARQTNSDNNLMLVGYAFYFVHNNLRQRQSKQAVQDLLFMEKILRGTGVGKKFVDWCDGELRDEGVQVVHQHVKTYLDFGPMLKSLGYRHVENVYSRRLDKN